METKQDLPTLLKHAETFHSRISLIAADHKTKKHLKATFKDDQIVNEIWKSLKIYRSLKRKEPFLALKLTNGETGFFGWFNNEYVYLYGDISNKNHVASILSELFKA